MEANIESAWGVRVEDLQLRVLGTVNSIKLETGLRPNSALIPYYSTLKD